jgi:AraC-like DNA-binding protein
MLFSEKTNYLFKLPVDANIFNNINSEAHWHNDVELILVHEGSLTMKINSHCYILKKGDIAICTSGNIHDYETIDRTSKGIIIIFRQEALANLINLPLTIQFIYPVLNSTTMNVLGLDKLVLENMQSCFEIILKEITLNDMHSPIFVKSRLAELIGLFTRHIPQYQNTFLGNNISSSVKLVQKATKYLEKNFFQDISLYDISAHLGISPYYFSKIFSKITGHTFKSYLNHIRIDRAHHLLKTTNEPIIDIAYKCGFNSVRTFNRAFKNIHGNAPSDQR